MPVIFSYFTEFQPKDKRGSMIVLLATFWMCGNIIAAGIAWLVIPLGYLGSLSDSFVYHSWRLYLALCTLPAVSSGFGFACMPESPKYLMQTGRIDEALRVFERIYGQNRKAGMPVTVDIPPLESASSSYHEDEDHCMAEKPGVRGRWLSFKVTVKKIYRSSAQLFSPSLRRTSIVMIIVWFTLSFGFYGMFMWFPELFSRIEKYGGTPCQLGSSNSSILTMPNTSADCSDVVDSVVYLESFLTAASNLPGNLFAFLLIDHIGRKTMLAGSMVLSGLSVFFIAILSSSTQSLIFSCIFGAISTIGWDALDVIGVELYPTELRSTASGLLMGLGRIAAILGNLAFGLLVDIYCLVPMFMVAGLLAVGGLASLILPNTTNTDLD